MTKVCAIAVCLTLVSGLAQAATVIGRMDMSSSPTGPAAANFPPATPKIYLFVELLQPEIGDEIEARRIATKTGVAAPGYVINTAAVTVTGATIEGGFSLTKPDSGWPAGDYQVDLRVNGAFVRSQSFTVR